MQLQNVMKTRVTMNFPLGDEQDDRERDDVGEQDDRNQALTASEPSVPTAPLR